MPNIYEIIMLVLLVVAIRKLHVVHLDIVEFYKQSKNKEDEVDI
jgi:hypothetical protein